MRKIEKLSVILFLSLFSFSFVFPASAFFPKIDTLFGITMPDISFAVGREADYVETTPEGERVIYNCFQPADYEAFGKYAKAAGLSIKSKSYQDESLSIELEKDGAIITFQYNYEKREASLLYPSNVHKEDQKNTSIISDSLLPDLNIVFGQISLPRISTAILRYPDHKEVLKDGSFSETYLNFTESDYNAYSMYLKKNTIVQSGIIL